MVLVMLDGEGCISKRNTSASINVSQREGAVWDRLVSYAKSRGYSACIEGDAAVRANMAECRCQNLLLDEWMSYSV